MFFSHLQDYSGSLQVYHPSEPICIALILKIQFASLSTSYFAFIAILNVEFALQAVKME